MRHRKRTIKLGRMSSHRKAMLDNMAASLIRHKKIHTTVQKARAAVPLIDKLILWGKKGGVHARRLAFAVLKDRTLVKLLFTEITPLMEGRNGGYTRIIRSGARRGDNAQMAILELCGAEIKEEPEKKEKKKIERKKEKEEKNK